jgi:hypothetical protein
MEECWPPLQGRFNEEDSKSAPLCDMASQQVSKKRVLMLPLQTTV